MGLLLVDRFVVGVDARRVIVADRRITGLSPEVIGELVAEVGPVWQARHDAKLLDRPRHRAPGPARASRTP